MSTRISEKSRFFPTRHAAFVPVVLFLSTAAACGQHPAEESIRNAQSDAQSVSSVADDHILCAPEGAAGFTRDCTIEHDGDTITVRNPDGGFHRLVIAGDGSVNAADGAEAAQVTGRAQGMSEVSIGGDRYRLPATP